MTSLPSSHAGASAHRRPYRAQGGVLASAPAWALLALIMTIAVIGCSAPTGTSSLAVVVVENRTDHPWRVALCPEQTAQADNTVPADAWQVVEPRATRRIEVPGGAYRVWRQMIDNSATDGSESESTRLNLAEGRTYAWPLATLFSTGEEVP